MSGATSWLAETWEMTPDGRKYTLHLRRGITWSDGVPLTSADVLFTFRAVTDKRVESPLADSLVVAGKPIDVSAPDDHTVVLTFPAPSGPGIRLLDTLPILPKHKLEGALAELKVASALIVVAQADEKIERSARNLPKVKVLRVEGLNVYDLMRYEHLILTDGALKLLQERLAA